MANEVIIEEYSTPSETNLLPIPTIPTKTQIKDIGVLPDPIGVGTTYIRIRSKGTGFWYAFNNNAVANTSPAMWLPADQFVDHKMPPNVTTPIDTAA